MIAQTFGWLHQEELAIKTMDDSYGLVQLFASMNCQMVNAMARARHFDAFMERTPPETD